MKKKGTVSVFERNLERNSDYCIASLRNVVTLNVKRELNEVNKVLSYLKVKKLDDAKI